MTGIEWTDQTWNPVIGCSHVSPGCLNCYAETMAVRLSGMEKRPEYRQVVDPTAPRWNGRVRLVEERLQEPYRWRKSRRVFVGSMSDLFHEDVPLEWIARVWAVMAGTPHITYQILTKRTRRMAQVLNSVEFGDAVTEASGMAWVQPCGEPVVTLDNVWIGTSVESDRYLFRVDHLREVRAAVRFLSLEPLLSGLPLLNLDGVHWVIAGGESGQGARPAHVGWFRGIRDRCVEAEVPFLFKQWGEWGWPASPDDHVILSDGTLLEPGTRLGMDHMREPTFVRRAGKREAGRVLDGRTWDQFPEVPLVPVMVLPLDEGDL